MARGVMQPVLPDLFQYVCDFSAIVRSSPPPSRVAQTLLDALVAEHSQQSAQESEKLSRHTR